MKNSREIRVRQGSEDSLNVRPLPNKKVFGLVTLKYVILLCLKKRDGKK